MPTWCWFGLGWFGIDALFTLWLVVRKRHHREAVDHEIAAEAGRR